MTNAEQTEADAVSKLNNINDVSNVKKQVAKVICLIENIPIDFRNTPRFIPYGNMIATLSDAVLQAGMNYETVVMPRIRHILANYSDFRTTYDLIILLQTHSVEEILQCKNKRKQEVFSALANKLYNEGVETEEELAVWLSNDENANALFKIKGVANKTIDYLKKLCGLQTVPIDRHMFHFLDMAGIQTDDYEEARNILTETATELGIEQSILDSAIWDYMSNLQLEGKHFY